jgi:hypothetical protein
MALYVRVEALDTALQRLMASNNINSWLVNAFDAADIDSLIHERMADDYIEMPDAENAPDKEADKWISHAHHPANQTVPDAMPSATPNAPSMQNGELGSM